MKKLFLLGALIGLSCQLWAQSFVQQVGQITDTNLYARTDIDFKVQQAGGLQVFIGQGAMHYQWIEPLHVNDSTLPYQAYRMDMQLIGANPYAELVLGDPIATYQRYFLSWVNVDNSKEGKVAIQYKSILYKDVYPHIDWQLYFTAEGDLEYDFIVHPGGDIAQIQWQYSGHEGLHITAHGDLELQTPRGTILQKAPISFEQASHLSVPSHYTVHDNRIGFQTGSYEGVLVIDPVIKWGTYFGDAADDQCHDIQVDKDGNVYMIGTTNSVNNIATQGAHQQSFGGGVNYLGADGFINKMDADGQLLWATYYGGTNIDILNAITVDSAGFLYIAGYSNSAAGIASDSAYQSTKKGTTNRYDALLIKMDTVGTRMWGTYFGGTMNDGDKGVAIDIDKANNIWLGSNTLSDDIPISANAHKTIRSFEDGYIARFTTDGFLSFCSYFGGDQREFIKGIKVDSNLNVYIIGETNSVVNLASTNAHQTTLGGSMDAFIAKLDSVATPIWATYIGGASNESANAIALTDSSVLVGLTTSSSNLAYGNAFQQTNTGSEGLIVDIATNGTMKMISYLGGNAGDFFRDILLKDSIIHILLFSNSSNLIVAPNAMFPSNSGGLDLVWCTFNSAWDFKYATYIGGNQIDNLGAIAAHEKNIFIAGSSLSNNNIGTIGTHQPLNAGSYDAFLIKIADCNPIEWISQNIIGADSICPNQGSLFQVNAQDSVVYHWSIPNTWQGGSDSNQILITPNTQAGSIAIWLSNACDLVSDTLFKTIGVFPTQKPIIQKQGNVLVCPQSFVTYQWLYENDSIAGATQNTFLPAKNGWYYLQVIDNKSCIHRSDSFLVDYLSVETIDKTTLHIYPNPAKAVVYIHSAEVGSLVIYNVLGQAVYSQPIVAGTQSIATTTWLTGMYTLVLQTANGSITYKLMKE
jgi:hypothetical protein